MPTTKPLSRTDGVRRGVTAGLAATVAMSAWMLGAQRLGFRRAEQPPRRIVEHVLDSARLRRPDAADDAVATVAHLGYGAALGVCYRWLRGRTRTPGAPVLHGALFGLGVWVANYAGWIPAAGIMPRPLRDHPNRQLSMLTAHLLFGAVLGAVGDPMRRREGSGPSRW